MYQYRRPCLFVQNNERRILNFCIVTLNFLRIDMIKKIHSDTDKRTFYADLIYIYTHSFETEDWQFFIEIKLSDAREILLFHC